jgi:protein-S-isoprenylcysteine O-methyltransferase Ste14
MLVALFVGSVIAWAALEAMASSGEPHERLPREIATGVALLAVHACAIGEHVLRGITTAPAMVVMGATLLGAGIALRVTAIRALGPAFVSTTTTPIRLVRTGPYRYLQHPSEVGLLAAAVGGAALLGSGIAAVVIAIVLVPLSVVRCAAEDRTIAACAR